MHTWFRTGQVSCYGLYQLHVSLKKSLSSNSLKSCITVTLSLTGNRLDCASLNWHIGYDIRDDCSIDIAQRVRCGSSGASCFSLDDGAFGAFPPSLDALFDGWVYAGTLVMGTGVLHLFLSHVMQAYLARNIYIIMSSYHTMICFFAIIGTTSSGGNKVLRNINFSFHVALYLSFFTTNSLMLGLCAKIWSSQAACVLHAVNFLCLIFVLAAFCFVVAVFGLQKPCNMQYMATGVLSISQQLFLMSYCMTVVCMNINSGRLDKAAWSQISFRANQQGKSLDDAQQAWELDDISTKEQESKSFITDAHNHVPP